ncbi:hypothetical protein Tco_0684171 [Tanacetum coccineum]
MIIREVFVKLLLDSFGKLSIRNPEESDGFGEITDFLNASYVQYALTINPTIYTTYIEQFWASAKANIINGEQQIQALVENKKIIITAKLDKGSIKKVLDLAKSKTSSCKEIAKHQEESQSIGKEKEVKNSRSQEIKEEVNWRMILNFAAMQSSITQMSKRSNELTYLTTSLLLYKLTRQLKLLPIAPTTTIRLITLAQTLIEIKAAKPKAVTSATTTTTTTRPKARNKGKTIMVEPERPLKKKDQVALDEEMARNHEAQMQAELIEEERLARQKEEEANIALIES